MLPWLQNNVFIEPENVRYLEGGGIQQTDGSFKPSQDRFGGANYFERETQLMHLVRSFSTIINYFNVAKCTYSD